MKRVFLIAVAALALALVVLPACKPPAKAVLDQEFQIRPGQQVSISGEGLSLEFTRVNEDSRCPTGVM